MTEIVAVVVITGILSALALSRFAGTSAEHVSARDTLISHIRYAQILAMKSNSGCGIKFTGNTYFVFTNRSPENHPVTFPGGDSVFPLPDTLGTATETIYFDPWGSPHTGPGLDSARQTKAIGNLGLTMITDTGFVQ